MIDSFLNEVRRTTLPNGLTLLTRRDRGSGVAAVQTWVRAGYFHEPDEVAGMAHLFEHMFFKGSRQFPGAEEIARHVSILGGSSNAGTIYDSTNYYFVLPSEGVQRAIEIQADAIAHPLFDPDELVKEAEVVIEESNRKMDNPRALAVERMLANAFERHRIRRWRIGSNEVLRSIRRDHLLEFFETLYRPENIIVVVAGDIDHDVVIATVEGTFGAIDSGTHVKSRGPEEPPQTSFRYGESFGDVMQSWSIFGWHTPGEGGEEEEALEIAAAVLGGGRYSRLYRHVVGPELASSVSASNWVYDDVGIFVVALSGEDANLARFESAALSEIRRLSLHGPSAFELALAKNRIESAFIFELDDVLGQSQTLAFFESRGGYEMIGEYLRKVAAVDEDAVRRAAGRYLEPANMTLFRYRPDGAPDAIREQAELQVRNAWERDVGKGPDVIEIPTAVDVVRPATMERAIQRYVLSNGMTLFVRERRDTPTVATTITFRGGRLHEHSRNCGITQLMARSMRRGTERRTDEEIDREIEFLGTQLAIGVDDDYVSFGLDILRDRFAQGLAVLSDVVARPTFPEEKIERERHIQLASIRRSLDSPTDRAFQLMFGQLYQSHPYGLPDAGTLDSVESISADDLRRWHSETIVADEAAIFVVGDVDAESVRDLMEESLGEIDRSSALRLHVPPLRFPSAPLEIVERRDRKQSAIVVGFPTVPPRHEDWPVLRLIQEVVSGLAGTFFAELRGRRALAYTVFAGDSSRNQSGCFIGYIGTEASKETEARNGLLDSIAALAGDGIAEDDLERGKSALAGMTKIRLQTNGALVGDMAHNYLFGLGLDFTERFLDRIRVIGLDEVRSVAERYLRNHNHVIAILRGRTE